MPARLRRASPHRAPRRAARRAGVALGATILAACADSTSARTPGLGQSVSIAPSVLSVSGAPNVFASDGSASVSAQVLSGGQPVAGATTAWSSSDSDVALVNSMGVVVGRMPGTAVVRARAGTGVASAAAVVVVQSGGERPVVVVAHRGFMRTFPENTLAAISGAFARGADAVEIDIRLSKDGVPVVMHDETVDRTTNGTGAVRDMTWAQLEPLDACVRWQGSWPRAACTVPTARQALATAHGHGTLLLHLYGAYSLADLAGLIKTIRDEGMEERVVFICFDLPTLRNVRQLDPALPLGYLVTTLPASLDGVASLGRAAIVPDLRAAVAAPDRARALTQAARERRIDSATWVVVTQDDAAAAIGLGFRTLISDVPLDRAAFPN